jgi:Outer membrane lipoprotein-sorting protein
MRAAQTDPSARIHSVDISSFVKLFFAFAISGAAFWINSIHAAEPASPAMSATELADRLDTSSQGSALIRSKLEVQSLDGAKRVLQLQIKQRHTKTTTDLVYLVLWPDEHKGEAVILHQAQGLSKGSLIVPQQPVRAIKASQMNEGLFDSDLSYQDAVENFFAWKKQTVIGSETINGVNCQILESKPDSSSVSIYAKVRSWIDPQRFVPMRIEKYSSSGELVRRIDVTRVARDEKHHPIPASLTVHGPKKGSVTEFTGARIDQDVQFTDADFTPAAIAKAAPSTP